MSTMQLHCNFCGDPFDADNPTQRFCSSRCGSRFTQVYRRTFKVGRPASRQREILAVLRSVSGTWITNGQIARTVYGSDDLPSRTATYHAIYRMRGTWGDQGLILEMRHRGQGSADWRLVRDIDEAPVFVVAS